MPKKQLQELTESMFYLLLTLRTPCHGYGIMRRVEEFSRGRVRMGAGTLYTLLARFSDEGYIRVVSDDGRKTEYVITEKGSELLGGEMTRLRTLISDAEGEGL